MTFSDVWPMTAIPATLRLRRESTLRSRAARGDATAFAAVYERHHQALYRHCRSILPTRRTRQDALQSTMTRAFAALQDEQRDFELRPCARSGSPTTRRSRSCASGATTTELDDIPMLSEIEDRVSEREELRLLPMDLADLPDRQRAALVLRELNGPRTRRSRSVLRERPPRTSSRRSTRRRSALFSAREDVRCPATTFAGCSRTVTAACCAAAACAHTCAPCAGCRRFQADIDQRSSASPCSPRRCRPPAPPRCSRRSSAAVARRSSWRAWRSRAAA